MWQSEIEQLVASIHAHPVRLVLAVTGGGSGAISSLLTVPGGSQTVLEASVPYSLEALTEWLGAPPEQACSSRTARAMAMAAFSRARRYAQLGKQGPPSTQPGHASEASLTGVGCTASLASDRPKRGAHRVHVAWQARGETVSACLELHKGARNRREEEAIAAALVLNLVASRCGLEPQLELPLRDGEFVATVTTEAPSAWRDLLLGAIDATTERFDDNSTRVATPGGETSNVRPAGDRSSVLALLPGAFDPLHSGHLRMAQLASEWLGVPVDYELSIANVDKPPLDFQELRHRLQPFALAARVWLTRAATFVDKARLFPGVTFVVGADTLARIADPRYCGGNPLQRDAAIDQLAAGGCRFLVFGRRAPETGRFLSIEQLELPARLRSISEQVPEAEFRDDISSTQLRLTRADDSNGA